jgi:hypothetical protein
MEEFENMDEKTAKTIEQAKSLYLRMEKVTEDKDVEKTAICFYDVIKQTYALAKEQNVFEKDKEDIILHLKGMMVMMSMLQMQHGWSGDMITEFDDKVMELWDVD